MPVATTARKAAVRALTRKVVTGGASVALSAVSVASRSRTLRRLAILQGIVLLFMVVVTPLLLLGISTSTQPGAEKLETGPVASDPADMPEVAVTAYRQGATEARELMPGCTLRPALLAGIYFVESGHGGGRLDDQGVATPPIVGQVMSAEGASVVTSGPGGFTATTWAAGGLDGSGDGVADPQNLHDAALTTGVILCRSAGEEPLDYRPVLETALAALGRPSENYADHVVEATDQLAAGV